ncbi:MAG TPA: M48 family metalloprotease [Lacunisphaera sp.]|nr:M48 family metalloprotease [Lacunisphaera sp.]
MSSRTLCLLLAAAVAAPALFAVDFGKMLDPSKLTKALDTMKDASKIAKGATGIGPEEEKTIGDSVALEIIAKFGGLVRDPVAMRRLNIVGLSLARYSARPDLEWRFALLNSDTVNAFSAPGGLVFITRGLYALADSDATLAGILGHEIAHITNRHALKIVERDEALSGITNIAAARSADVRKANEQLAQFGLSVNKVTGALFKGFDPQTEFTADKDGRALALTAGYQPGGLRAALTQLKGRGENRQTMFSSHPPLADRLQRLPDEAAPPADYVAPTPAAVTVSQSAGPKIALAELLPKLTPAAPFAIARPNGHQVLLQSFNGASAWLRADAGDLVLQVVRGSVMVEFRSGPVAVGTGEFLTIAKGTEYRTLGDATAAAVVVSP